MCRWRLRFGEGTSIGSRSTRLCHTTRAHAYTSNVVIAAVIAAAIAVVVVVDDEDNDDDDDDDVCTHTGPGVDCCPCAWGSTAAFRRTTASSWSRPPTFRGPSVPLLHYRSLCPFATTSTQSCSGPRLSHRRRGTRKSNGSTVLVPYYSRVEQRTLLMTT